MGNWAQIGCALIGYEHFFSFSKIGAQHPSLAFIQKLSTSQIAVQKK
jgi:hypothetical protein